METSNFGVCRVTIAPVRAEASDRSEIVTQLLFGDYVEVLEIERPWAKIRMAFDGYEGFIDFKQLLYISKEDYDTQSQMKHVVVSNAPWILSGPDGTVEVLAGSSIPNLDGQTACLGKEKYTVIEKGRKGHFGAIATSLMFLNVPYLWGGRSMHGIDCSGYTQTVAKIHGLDVPRDASAQVDFGKEIAFEDRKPGDIPFFINKEGVVHHVGVLTTKDRILHASGWIREDKFDEKGIFRLDMDEYSHHYHSIRRWFSE